ncbi:MAG TPA: choice-of-anchor D domain-containing protein [Candidatus Binataceae bacterium]|nr:choice-of-anchor D domain-containing protein [Candidatus Binataceae bacterium]
MKVAKMALISALIIGLAGSASAQMLQGSLKIEPTALSFGKVRPGATSVRQDVVLLNPTDVTLKFTSVTATGPFSISGNTCGSALTPGHSCQISVKFHPASKSKPSVRPQTGTLTITDNVTNSPQVLKLAGIVTKKLPKSRRHRASNVAIALARPTGVTVDADGAILVANSSNNSVSVYAPGADGAVEPIAAITGKSTGLMGPNGVALDAIGNIYVANVGQGAPPRGSITVYSANANGNASPIATINGSNTGLNNPQGVALDSVGNIYVANSIGGAAGAGSITIYPAGSNGNMAPSATISGSTTGMDQPSGIALDEKGNIYVANTGGGESHHGSVTVYRGGSSGDAAPIANISGTATGLRDPEGLAIDSSGNLYAANFNGNSVTVYSAGSSGNAAPIATIGGKGAKLAEPTGIALDLNGVIYVTNQGVRDLGPYSITVHPAGANGNVAPVATIKSKSSKSDSEEKLAREP